MNADPGAFADGGKYAEWRGFVFASFHGDTKLATIPVVGAVPRRTISFFPGVSRSGDAARRPACCGTALRARALYNRPVRSSYAQIYRLFVKVTFVLLRLSSEAVVAQARHHRYGATFLSLLRLEETHRRSTDLGVPRGVGMTAEV